MAPNIVYTYLQIRYFLLCIAAMYYRDSLGPFSIIFHVMLHVLAERQEKVWSYRPPIQLNDK